MYHIPKIHKNATNPPGRSIISGIDSLTSPMGSYIDHFFQELIVQLPSYVRDSGHMLEILAQYQWQAGYRWLSLDVASLYTTIQYQFGLQAVQYFLACENYLHPMQASFIMRPIVYTLTQNYFVFQDVYYRQTKGTAMGARFTLRYANLFRGYWEQFHILSNIPYEACLVLCSRYIDDILIIWDLTATWNPFWLIARTIA